MLDHVPGARGAEHGRTGVRDDRFVAAVEAHRRRVHATDATNASRTMLFNIHTGEWDDELLRLLEHPARDAAGGALEQRSVRRRPNLFGGPIPIAGIAGDQQAALFGQTCFSRGLAKNTYGTGCFMLMNIGEEPVASKHQLLTTVAWKLAGKTSYALEGSVFIGGAVVQWLRDGLGIIKSPATIEELAASVPDSGGVYLVPAFAGLGAPHWDQYARGTITGITRGTTAAHFARAALEGIAFQVADVLEVMQQDSGIPIERTARRWRRGGEQPADAVPGRSAGRAGRAAEGHGDDGARRGVSCRTGGRILEKCR